MIICVILALVVLALVSVAAAIAWFAMIEEDGWFDEDQARMDAEEMLRDFDKEINQRPRVRAISD